MCLNETRKRELTQIDAKSTVNSLGTHWEPTPNQSDTTNRNRKQSTENNQQQQRQRQTKQTLRTLDTQTMQSLNREQTEKVPNFLPQHPVASRKKRYCGQFLTFSAACPPHGHMRSLAKTHARCRAYVPVQLDVAPHIK